MKKIISLILALLILGSQAVFAEEPLQSETLEPVLPFDLTTCTDDDLLALSEAVAAEMLARGLEATRETLQKGSSGEAVQALQARLIDLNYLSGSADGDYGNKTKSAIELFQTEAGLEVTGIADPETQKKLFAEDAPVAKVYLDLDFKAISRDPDSYTGKHYKFTGKVVQVLEEEMDNYTYVALRIATKGNYDNVVYVTHLRENGEARILEDDRVTVYASCLGLYTYETVIGGSVTLPNFLAESVTLN